MIRKHVADNRIRLKGRFINYSQAVFELGLDPTQQYQVSYLKSLISKHSSNTNTPIKESNPLNKHKIS